jgi:hypothetical protein
LVAQSPTRGLAYRPKVKTEARGGFAVLALRQTGREVDMKLVKRFAVALGSLLAVALAGGAHWRW